jgi:outer membrane receptor protein involved in Fe transport
MTPVIIGSVTVPPFGPIPVSQAQNKPSAEISGVEADVAGGAGPVSADVNYTYQRAMGNSATSAKFVPLRLTPTHQINGQVTWTSPWKTTASVIGRYVSRQLTADGSFDNQMPPYAVWGTRLGQRVGPAEVFAGIDNVFDRHYATSFEFGNVFDPQPGRTTYAGVNLTFR